MRLLLTLISKHQFDQPAYYETLYDTMRQRQSVSIELLKIVEISLKSRRLAASTIHPFLKLMLRLALKSGVREACWYLGLTLNLLKMNDAATSFFQSDQESDKFDETLTF